MLRVHRAAVALVVAATVPGCVATPQASDAPPTEPVGVVLPTWHVGADGAAALLEGRLVLIDRCVYVAAARTAVPGGLAGHRAARGGR